MRTSEAVPIKAWDVVLKEIYNGNAPDGFGHCL